MPDILTQVFLSVICISVVVWLFGVATAIREYIEEAARAKRKQADAYRDFGDASLIAARTYAASLAQQPKGHGGGDG